MAAPNITHLRLAVLYKIVLVKIGDNFQAPAW
jgi:hypothetical protein